jgi:serpin B
MRRRILLGPLFALLAALLPGAPLLARAPLQPGCDLAAPQASGSFSRLVAADNAFAFRLFPLLSAYSTTANTVVSSLSAALAIQLTNDGARGGTQAAMARALGLDGMTRQEVRQQAAALLAALTRSDPKVQMDIANSIWARLGVRFRADFLQHARSSYAARVTALDFRSPQAASTINGWVSCATHKTITSIVDRIPSSVIMYLIDAVYFHGAWSSPFESGLTREQPFTTGAGRQEEVPLMAQRGSFDYYRGSDFQEVALPYGGDRRFEMDVLLPRRGLSLAQLERRLTPAVWGRWTSSFRPTGVALSLPRFRLSNSFNLDKPLKTLGMGAAFDGGADFSGLCIGSCSISSIRQGTFLRVDERGTTAAAVTVVGIATAMPRITSTMTVDRPFLTAIRDSRTGAILFLGAINDPLARQ